MNPGGLASEFMHLAGLSFVSLEAYFIRHDGYLDLKDDGGDRKKWTNLKDRGKIKMTEYYDRLSRGKLKVLKMIPYVSNM